MADYVVNITAKDNISGTLKQISQDFDNIGNTARESAKEIDKTDKELGHLGESSKVLDYARQRFEKITQSTAPAKKQLRELQMLMANMNLNGLSNTETFTEIAQRAGVLRDAMTDAQSAVNAYANDVFTMKAAGEVFTGIAAAGSIATGIVGMFGAENEKVKEILLKVQSAQAILNGVTTIANILNKDSALMLKIKQVWMKASTASTKADTVATVANNAVQATANVTVKKGTIVQTAWNTAKAIGKAMLGDFTGLLLLGIGAVTAYGIATADTTEKEKKQTDATNKLKEAQENYAKSVGQEFGRLMSAYMTLRTAWNELKTDGEKMQFLKEQKSSIDNLTDSVKDITSAERFFNQESDRVIESFKLRAKAAAAAALAVSKYQEAMESLQNAQGAGLRGAFVSLKNADKLPQELKDKLKAEYDVQLVQKSWGPAQAATPGATSASYEEQKVLKGYTIPVDLDEKSLAQLAALGLRNSRLQKEGKKTMQEADKYIDEQYRLLKEADKLNRQGGNRQENNNRNNQPKTNKSDEIKDVVEAQKRANDIQKKIDEVRALINSGALTQPNIDKAEDIINGYETELESIEINWDIRPQIEKDSLDKELDRLDERLNHIELKPRISSFDVAIGTNDYDYTTIKTDDIEGRISAIQKMMDFNDNLIAQLQSLKNAYTALGDAGASGLEKVNERLQQVKESQSELAEKAKEYKDEQDEQDQEAEKATNLAQAYQLASNAVSSLGSVFSNLGQITDEVGLQAAGIIAQAVATMIQSYTTAAAQAAKMGPWVWAGFALSGLAQVTSVVSQLKSLGSYANGGIITGSSTMGDQLLARVNGGEMILNSRQQNNLFNAIDHDRLGGPSTIVGGEIKIKGSDLYVALRNYNRVQGGTGKNIGIR